MSTTEPNGIKPHIIVSEADERSLTRLAADALRRSPDVSEELLAEIERAHIVPGSLVPPGVVQMDRSLSSVRRAVAPGACSWSTRGRPI